MVGALPLFRQFQKDNSANFALTEFSEVRTAPVEYPRSDRAFLSVSPGPFADPFRNLALSFPSHHPTRTVPA
jgi:hypothetical protein